MSIAKRQQSELFPFSFLCSSLNIGRSRKNAGDAAAEKRDLGKYCPFAVALDIYSTCIFFPGIQLPIAHQGITPENILDLCLFPLTPQITHKRQELVSQLLPFLLSVQSSHALYGHTFSMEAVIKALNVSAIRFAVCCTSSWHSG